MGRMKGLLFVSLAVLLLAVPLLGACTKEVVRKWPPKEYMEVDGRTDKSSYSPGEDIVIELSFKSLCSEPVMVRPFPPEIQIMLSSEVVRSFAAGSGALLLEPGEPATHALIWDQEDGSGQQVAPDYYHISVKDFYIYGAESGTVRYGFGAGKVLVLPQGALEKSIEINQSATVNGITITLERVELSAMGGKVYAFNVPPDYNLPQGPSLPPSRLMIRANAEYSVDGGPIQKAGPSAIRFLENGMVHTWDMSDPVAKGTKELAFIITKLGDSEGPWKFRVSLE